VAERPGSAFPLAAKFALGMLALAFLFSAVVMIRQQQQINKLRQQFAPCGSASYWVQQADGNVVLRESGGCIAIPQTAR
jgi:hypothetical protein